MEQRLSIITLGVSDLKASEKFYLDQFGWERDGRSNEQICFMHMHNGLFLSLYAKEALAEDAGVNPQGSGFRGISLAYNTRSEAEVDEIFAKLSEKGIGIVKAPEKVFWGGYSGYIADPDGYLWEIAYNPFVSLDAEGNIS